jgi:DNA-binding transcriptional regulator YbjK
MSSRPANHRPSGLARREALLRAALEIVAERGVGGATHRAIAERAGLPASSTTYFFPTIDDLILEALRFLSTERVAQLELLTAQIQSLGPAPDAVAELFATTLVATPEGPQVAQFEAYLEATRRSQEARAAAREVMDAFQRLVVAALTAAGAADPERAAPAFLALADGFSMQRLVRGPSNEDAALLADAFGRLFAAYAETPRA